jgi:hypothetical protein
VSADSSGGFGESFRKSRPRGCPVAPLEPSRACTCRQLLARKTLRGGMRHPISDAPEDLHPRPASRLLTTTWRPSLAGRSRTLSKLTSSVGCSAHPGDYGVGCHVGRLSAPLTEAERPYLAALGRRVKAARDAAGVTRAYLADATGPRAFVRNSAELTRPPRIFTFLRDAADRSVVPAASASRLLLKVAANSVTHHSGPLRVRARVLFGANPRRLGSISRRWFGVGVSCG